MLSPAAREHEAPPSYDPGWLIHRTLDSTVDAAGASAEDAVLAWLVRLPDETDPADAAAEILQSYAPVAEADGDLTARVVALLAQIRDYPRERLGQMPSPRWRGRRGRRGSAPAD